MAVIRLVLNISMPTGWRPSAKCWQALPMLKEILEFLEPVVRDAANEHPAFNGKSIRPDEIEFV